MRLVQLDDLHVVDADRVEALVEHTYTQPETTVKVAVHLRSEKSFYVDGDLLEVMAKLRSGPDLTK